MTFPETAKLVFFARKAHGGKKKRRLAPCWLTDLISGHLIDEAGDSNSTNDILHVGCATAEFRREVASKNGFQYPNTIAPPLVRHELLLKGHQSFQNGKDMSVTQSSRRADGSECDEVLACVCQNCRYHFTIYIDRGSKEHLCGTLHNNKTDPFHHLVHVYTNKTVPRSINTKFYPYHALARYMCSAAQCNYKISVEISKPRLSERLLGFLTNNDAIRNRLKRAIEEEPERFSDVANVTPNALAYLRAYLRDIVDEKREKNPDGSEIERKIDQRNKKFYIQFGNGPEAAELLTYLGFEEMVNEDNRSWKVPNPPVTRPTRPGSQLAFYQDVKSEVETIMGKDSQNMKPNAAISFITSALDIGTYYTSPLTEEEIMARYQVSDYARLGLSPSLSEVYFWYAYTCQRQANPSDETKFFESLERLTIGRDSEELELRVQSAASVRTMQPQNREVASLEEDEIRRATELSLQDFEQPSVAHQSSSVDSVIQAYKYFGLDEGQRSDDEVLGKFVLNSEAYPSQKNSYREKLLLIARHTKSSNIERIALKDMTTEEAYQYLDIPPDTTGDYIASIAQYQGTSNEKDYALVVAALFQIDRARGGEPALVTAAQGILSEHNKAGDLTAAGFDQMDLDSSSTRPQVVNMSLPVGLENIRNTCYLNSILQYFYTVKPIHTILENIDELGLPNTEASLQSRRIDPGSTHLEKSEAYAGRQFVEQISSLYHDMQMSQESALRPQQRLAIAALKNSASLMADGKQLLENDQKSGQDHSVAFNLTGPSSRSGTPAPPLPLRHTPASLAAAAQNTTVHVNSQAPLRTATATHVTEAENADSSSLRSSQTLVMDEGRIGDQEDGYRQPASQMSVSMEEVQEDDDVMRNAPVVTHVEKAGDQSAPPSYEIATSGAAGDTAMTDAPPSGVQTVFDPPPMPEPTVEEKIDRALNDSRVTGTDQQDVEEVMGNIISHLRAAVRDTGTDVATGAQRDPITDTFFWTSATYSRSDRNGRYNRQVAPNRWVTAYPEENGKTHLLQALNNNFLREFITQGTWYERFTSIVSLPPILHIHIQRGRGDGTKNKSPVAIPEVLHLDQFMDCQEGTDLFSRRRHAWNLHERIRSLKGPNSEIPNICFPPDAVDKATLYTNLVADAYLKQHTGIDDDSGNDKGEKVIFDDFDDLENITDADGYVMIDNDLQEMITVADVSAPDISDEIAATEKYVDLEIAKKCDIDSNRPFVDEASSFSPDEVQQFWTRQDLANTSNERMRILQDKRLEYEQELEGLFSDLKDPKYEYRLHAVVCHSGNTGTAGHYWVWVYDFEKQLWRKYNDSIVLEEPDTAKVITELSNQGEPYYLAYVRVADIEEYVSVPRRKDLSKQEAELFPSGVPPPPPRPHHESVLKRITEEDSSDTSSPKSTPLTDDVSASNLSPAPPATHPKAHRLTTPPLEADETQTPAIGGNNGQADCSSLVSRPMLPLSPPAQLQALKGNGQMQ
ncbi:ubiquitin-specific protease ubp2 [Sporothrix eucalyptigena]